MLLLKFSKFGIQFNYEEDKEDPISIEMAISVCFWDYLRIKIYQVFCLSLSLSLFSDYTIISDSVILLEDK